VLSDESPTRRCRSLKFGPIVYSRNDWWTIPGNVVYLAELQVRVLFEDPSPGSQLPNIKIVLQLYHMKRPATRDEMKRVELSSLVRNAVSPSTILEFLGIISSFQVWNKDIWQMGFADEQGNYVLNPVVEIRSRDKVRSA